MYKPVVKVASVATRDSKLPSVTEVPEITAMLPLVVVLANTDRKPTAPLEVKLPVALNEIAPFVAIAPVVEEVALSREPDVKPVVETIDTSTPVVAAPAVTNIIPVPVYAPDVLQDAV